MKIAIIGSGISGLTAGYLLSRNHDVTMFEKNNYIGGHTHTHDIEYEGKIWHLKLELIYLINWTFQNLFNIINKLQVKVK